MGWAILGELPARENLSVIYESWFNKRSLRAPAACRRPAGFISGSFPGQELAYPCSLILAARLTLNSHFIADPKLP